MRCRWTVLAAALALLALPASPGAKRNVNVRLSCAAPLSSASPDPAVIPLGSTVTWSCRHQFERDCSVEIPPGMRGIGAQRFEVAHNLRSAALGPPRMPAQSVQYTFCDGTGTATLQSGY